MSHGSTLLVTPSGLPTKDHTALKQKSSGMKRRNPDRASLSRLSDVHSPTIAFPSRKKFRQCIGSHDRSSKVRWGSVVNCIADYIPSDLNEDIGSENGDGVRSTGARNEKWYSKAEYKQMMLDQCLTVHIMRSLRSLAGEKVPTDYCDEEDTNSRRFDELIKKHSIDPEEYCERGLESYLSDERRNGINATRKLHKLLVISEYDRQRMSDKFDLELVRDASLNHSKKSSVRARKLALIDQREAEAGNKLDKEKYLDQKQDMCRHKLKRHDTNPVVERMSLSSYRLWSLGDQEFQTETKIPSTSTSETKMLRNENQFSSESIRDAVIKQQLVHLLLKQEQEYNQRSHSQYHLNQNNLNSITSSFKMQEQGRLFHLTHKQQKQEDHYRLQVRLQDQCNYQQQVQRLLLLQQHQQHYEAVQLASATILKRCHR